MTRAVLPRLIVMELASAYEVTLVDSASEIISEAGKMTEFGRRVVVARPGEFCLDCARQIVLERANRELQSESARDVARSQGYGLGDDLPAPAVVSLIGVIANLAVTEFLMMVVRIRAPYRHLT